MKTKITNSLNNPALIFLTLVSIFVWSCGCNTSKPVPDPLAGFHAASKTLDQSIVNDYQNYIQNLSPEEKKYLGPYPVSFFEDGTGQHAVRIKIGINGTSWEHVLIYDKDNKRIKTIKYSTGHYAS
jgi:hypothetical protein